MAEKKTSAPAAGKTVKSSPAKPAEAASAKKPAARKTAKAPAGLTVEQLEREIREEAQQVYETRCAAGGQGDEISDWLEAERRVRAKHSL
jgi:hypothetical protein